MRGRASLRRGAVVFGIPTVELSLSASRSPGVRSHGAATEAFADSTGMAGVGCGFPLGRGLLPPPTLVRGKKVRVLMLSSRP